MLRGIDNHRWGTIVEASIVVNVSVLQRGPATMSAMPSELVRVLSTSSIMEGEIAKARLEGEGIPVLLKGGGLDPYTTGVAYVFVPAEFEAQARLLLEDVVDDQPEGSESA
jgi:hypothetical protein